jgi:hypothetical protein
LAAGIDKFLRWFRLTPAALTVHRSRGDTAALAFVAADQIAAARVAASDLEELGLPETQENAALGVKNKFTLTLRSGEVWTLLVPAESAEKIHSPAEWVAALTRVAELARAAAAAASGGEAPQPPPASPAPHDKSGLAVSPISGYAQQLDEEAPQFPSAAPSPREAGGPHAGTGAPGTGEEDPFGYGTAAAKPKKCCPIL